MIILASYVVLFDKGGNPVLAKKKTVAKWDNDFDFGFDITDPVAFRRFLASYRLPNGKLLPHVTKYGDRIVYKVYTWGTPNWMKELFPPSVRDRKVLCLFPGMTPDGRTIDLVRFGHIRK